MKCVSLESIQASQFELVKLARVHNRLIMEFRKNVISEMVLVLEH
jgi:hypothetical protein